jgi:hypothetical protein
MKKIILAAVAALVLAGCGGGGHSDSYNKGYKWSTVTANNDLAVFGYAEVNGPDGTCHHYATEQAVGLNQQEWIQGCMDGMAKQAPSQQSGGTSHDPSGDTSLPPFFDPHCMGGNKC